MVGGHLNVAIFNAKGAGTKNGGVRDGGGGKLKMATLNANGPGTQARAFGGVVGRI